MQPWAVSLVAAVVVCAVVGGLIAPGSDKVNAGFVDAASVLAVISLAAVSIERAIEGLFAAMSGKLGEWWPLRVARDEFNAFEASTNAVLKDVAQDTIAALETARDQLDGADARVVEYGKLIDRVAKEKERLDGQLEAITAKLPPGSARLARLGEIHSAMTATLTEAHAFNDQATSAARDKLRTSKLAAEQASLVISSFTDNPARRVASLVIGASAGMLIAAGLGLNLFQATLQPPAGTEDIIGLLSGKLGVLLTGIVIGLGSSPTHEVVKSLQAYKDARAGSDAVMTVASATAPVPAATVAVNEGAGPMVAGGGAGSVVVWVRPVRRS